MTVVKIEKPLGQVLDIINAMKAEGYTQGTDFDFAYHPYRWDPMTGNVPAMTDFTFYTDELSLMFVLKYGT